MRYGKQILAGLAALVLSGCYTSDTALLTRANADAPFPKTLLHWTDFDGDALDKPGTDHLTSVFKDGAYQFTDDEGKTTPVLFKKLGGNFYVIQEAVPSEPDGKVLKPIYFLVRIEGKSFYIYDSMCSPAAVARFKAAIVKTEGDANMPTCYVKDLAGLSTVMTALESAKPFQRNAYQ